jgi:hypothetical protein
MKRGDNGKETVKFLAKFRSTSLEPRMNTCGSNSSAANLRTLRNC